MDDQLLYQEDPLRLEFETQVREKVALSGDRLGLILERTYFYPTGGGQEHDTGSIGPARVLDVYKHGEPPVLVHVVDQDVPSGPLPARIDALRRLRAMQHHTAQHLLSQCFLRLLGLETLSANINTDTPSTVDFSFTELSPEQLRQVEDLANQVIYENRVVKSYFVTPEDIAQVPLRRPPKVSENIRIIEIDGYDHSACGGTHVPHTGMIGVVKILRTERQNEKTRVHFIAGWQALEAFQAYHSILGSLAVQLNTGIHELTQAVPRQAELLRAAQKELQGLRLEHMGWEARTLAEQAPQFAERRLVVTSFENRPASELRALADHLRSLPGVAALLASYDGQKLSLVSACAPQSGLDARQLLQSLLAEVSGRGGGDAQIAQGGGSASPQQLQALLEHARRLMQPSG
jgi:alanyl-tRNA synthetase